MNRPPRRSASCAGTPWAGWPREFVLIAANGRVVYQRIRKLARFFNALKIDGRAIDPDRKVKRPSGIGLRNEVIGKFPVANGAALNFFNNGMEWSFSDSGFRLLRHVALLREFATAIVSQPCVWFNRASFVGFDAGRYFSSPDSRSTGAALGDARYFRSSSA